MARGYLAFWGASSTVLEVSTADSAPFGNVGALPYPTAPSPRVFGSSRFLHHPIHPSATPRGLLPRLPRYAVHPCEVRSLHRHPPSGLLPGTVRCPQAEGLAIDAQRAHTQNVLLVTPYQIRVAGLFYVLRPPPPLPRTALGVEAVAPGVAEAYLGRVRGVSVCVQGVGHPCPQPFWWLSVAP